PLRHFAVAACLIVCVLLSTTVRAEDANCRAVVYSARVAGGGNYSTANLAEIARTRGSKEVIEFDCGAGPDAVISRRIITMGEPGVGQPGFTSRSRAQLNKSLQSGATVSKSTTGSTVEKASPDSSVTWHLPTSVGKAPFMA